MAVEVIMPKVDMDQEKSTILTWNKAEGDTVKQDETLLSVETEKVAIDVASPAAGTLAGIRFKEGDVVPIGTLIAYILAPGEDKSAIPGSAPAAAAAKQAVTEAKSSETTADQADAPAAPAAEKQPAQAGDKIAATPIARRMAKENDLTLSSIQGSGPFGRIQAADVEKVLQAQTTKPTAAGERKAQVIPLNSIRQKIAGRLQASFRDAPHIFLSVEADVSRLEEARAVLNQKAQASNQAKITFTAMLVKITAWALQRNPKLNSSLVDDAIYQWEDVNIGVATALEEGLIVPVIHQANQLSLSEISEKVNDLSGRARTNKLTLAEVKNGTFTISNLGMFGIPHFTAVINPPESAILAVGSVVRKPVVVDEEDNLEVLPMLGITLSADHRVIDGAVAARFLQDLVEAIETPEIML